MIVNLVSVVLVALASIGASAERGRELTLTITNRDFTGFNVANLTTHSADRCADLALDSSLYFFTWNPATNLCQLKSPSADHPDATMVFPNSTFELLGADFDQQYDLFRVNAVNATDCRLQCDHFAPLSGCALAVFRAPFCSIKYPYGASNLVAGYSIPERRDHH